MPVTYKIGEAAALLNLKTYVLRFWETEFSQITPLRTEKGQRLYTEEHLALLDRIRFLLHERGLTIEGTRKVLAEEASRGVRYVRAQGREQDDGSPDGALAEYDSAAERSYEGESVGIEGEYSEVLSHANTPDLPGYGLAPAPQNPDAAPGVIPGAAQDAAPDTAFAAAGTPTSIHEEAPPTPTPQAESSGLTSGVDRRKNIPIGLGVGFETTGGKRKADAVQAMEQGMLMQADTVAAVKEAHPDAASGNVLEEAGDAASAEQRGGPAALTPHSDWDDIKNAFNAGPEDDGWDLVQSNEAPAGRDTPGTNAHNAIKEITAELEAVAELLRGSTAGTSS